MDKLLPIIRRKRRPLIDVDASAMLPTIPTGQTDAVSQAAPPEETATVTQVDSKAALPQQGGDIRSPASPSPVSDVSAPKSNRERSDDERATTAKPDSTARSHARGAVRSEST